MKLNLLLLCVTCSTMAHAQFSGTYAPANWTITHTNSAGNSSAAVFGTVDTSGAPNSITINGPDGNTNAYSSISYSIVASQAGTVSFSYSITNADVPEADFLFWGKNTTMIDSVGPSPTGSGTVNFQIAAGERLVIGVSTIDDQLGALNATISNFSVTAPLPVEGTALRGTVTGTGNLLNWTTFNEANNKGFEIQRSLDARTFASIGFIPSKSATGDSKTALDYTFSDNAATQEAVYYRYRQVDRDGGESYSNVVVLKQATAVNKKVWSVYPNPVTPFQALSLNNLNEGTLRLFNASGILVHTQYVNKQAVLPLPAHLVPGTYFAVLQTVTGKQSTALVIQ